MSVFCVCYCFFERNSPVWDHIKPTMRRVRINVHTSKWLLLLSNNQYITLYNHSPVTPLRVRSVAVYILHTWCKYINKYLYPQHFLVFFWVFLLVAHQYQDKITGKRAKKQRFQREKWHLFVKNYANFHNKTHLKHWHRSGLLS